MGVALLAGYGVGLFEEPRQRPRPWIQTGTAVSDPSENWADTTRHAWRATSDCWMLSDQWAAARCGNITMTDTWSSTSADPDMPSRRRKSRRCTSSA